MLRGREPLERHLHGGVPLDAQISRPLLESLFDPHSSGHDGAVIIEDGRITQFGAHLPLSRNHQQLADPGTRHMAAIGLSERCDALVVVVSEERGRISVAEHGKLRQMASIVDFEERLEKFWRHVFPQAESSLGLRLLRANFALKAGSLALACLAWFFLSFQVATVQQSFLAPVEFRNVPENYEVASSDPVSVNVTLSGPERAFFLLDPSTLKVSFDVSKINEGPQVLSIEDRNVARPSQLEVSRIEPRTVRTIVHQLKPVTLQVDVPLVGELPEPLRLGGVQVEPKSVRAMSWLDTGAGSQTIQVEPVDLSQIGGSTSFTTQLIVPEYVRFSGEAPAIRVTINVTQAAAGE